MSKRVLVHCLKAAGAFAAVVALSGCIIVPAYGPRYGYYYHPRPYGYY